jgi:hypothetical protein
MRSITIFGKTVTNWQLLHDNLEPHLAEMPHLQGFSNEIEQVITEARGLDAEQEIARGKLRELTRRRREVEKRGENVRRRVASHLKGTFGFTSEQLIQFGIAPRPTKTRPRKTTPTPEDPQAKTTAQQ